MLKRFLPRFFWAMLMPAFLLVSCLKAGEDDPLISLRSKKGRLSGKWKVVKAYYSSVYDRMPQYSSTKIDFENGNFAFRGYEKDFTLNQTYTDTTGTYEWTMDFTRSKNYTSLLTLDGSRREVKGNWEFASRDSLLMTSTQFMADAGFLRSVLSFFTQGKYYVKELRNDKVVFSANNDFSTGELVNLEIVLEPQ